MTLDEAIKHCKEKAKELSNKAYEECGISMTEEEAYDCNECAREHEQLSRWLEDYKRLLEEKRPHGKWIPVSEGLPDNDGGCYLVSLDNGQIVVADSGGIIENHDFEPRMLAWQPLPEPYKKGGADMRGES